MSLPAAFVRDAERLIPQDRRFTDALSTLAFGTDASFYRLIPKLVIRVESEDEVVELLHLARRDQVAVTVRAAGTSQVRNEKGDRQVGVSPAWISGGKSRIADQR